MTASRRSLDARNLLAALIILGATPVLLSTQSTTGTISGRVVDGATNAVVANARVSVSRTYRNREEATAALDRAPSPAGQTSTDGSFRLAGLEAGQWIVRARKDGYVGGYFGQAEPSADETIQKFDIRAAEDVKDVVVRLWKGSVLSGRILSDSDVPLAGRRVQAFRLDPYGSGPLTLRALETPAVTDERGEYRVSGLDPGRYLVQTSATDSPSRFQQIYSLFEPRKGMASLIDLSVSPVFFPGVLSPSQARLVVLRAGEDAASIDITVPSAVNVTSIAGRVRNLPQGFSACRVRLVARGLPPPLGDGFEMTAVDAADDGSFFFSNVAPGTYEIRGVVWGLSGPSPSAMWFSRDVFVGSGAVRDLDLVAQAGARITGRVAPDDNLAFTAEELRSFRVLIEPVGGWSLQGIEQPTVEVDNTFSTPGLPPGRYSIFVSPLSVGSVSRIVESNVNVRDVGIELSGKDADVTVVLRRKPVTIQGIVTDASGALRPEAYLVYFPSDRRAWNSATVWRDRPNRFGQFTVAVGPGDYTVAAVEGGLPEDWRSPEFLSKVVPRGLRVVVERANVVSQRVALQRISR